MRLHVGWVAMWSGGNSYAAPDNSHAEFFPTLEAAKSEFRKRYEWSSADIRPVYVLHDGRAIQSGLVRENVGTPVVDSAAYMYLAPLFDNEVMGEWCKLIEFGPRMGIRVTDI